MNARPSGDPARAATWQPSPPQVAVTEIVDLAGPHVGPALAGVEERLVAIAADSGPVLSEHATGTMTAGGKRLRPLLVVLAAGGDGEAVERGAVAVELIHAATLVHDDVLDAAALRRGRPTVVAAGGRDMAVATGDLLFARAFTELLPSGVEAVRALGQACSALAEGELLQRADAFDAGVSVERYLRRCELKTACLFVAACRLGSLAAGQTLDALASFARDVGLAFQILDDVLDVSGPAERTGKHRGTDLLDGTVTLPFILARERDPSLEAPAGMTAQEAEAICDRIAATGALEDARARALDLVARAKAELPPGFPQAQRRALELVADSVVARYA